MSNQVYVVEEYYAAYEDSEELESMNIVGIYKCKTDAQIKLEKCIKKANKEHADLQYGITKYKVK